MILSGGTAAAEHHASRSRALGALMLAGGTLAWITAVLPPDARGSDVIVLTYGAVAVALGLVLVFARDSVPEPLLGVVVAFGTLMITLGTHEGGPQIATEDNAMLYVWVCLYAFYFFSLPHAMVQIGFVGVAYALLLAGTGPTDGLVTRWGVTVGTLLIAGMTVTRLKDRINSLIGELSARARQDDLTGTLNREGLEERTAVELDRARRDGSELSLIVLDIDRFKDLNDQFGHHAGDEVLRRVASALMRSTRAIDATARVGGDEFAVVLPGAGAVQAHSIAERLRGEIRERGVGTDGSPIMVSVGIATAPGSGGTLDQLWRAADLAMYEGKRAGGDDVRMADRKPDRQPARGCQGRRAGTQT